MSQAKEELRWALIGASDIAKTRMIKAINSQPNSRGAAVFSSNADRAKAYAAENKIPEDLYVHSVRHFNQAVLTGTQPFATGADGLRSLAVALAALESSKSGRRTLVQNA